MKTITRIWESIRRALEEGEEFYTVLEWESDEERDAFRKWFRFAN